MAVHGALGAGLLAVRPPAAAPRVIVPFEVVVRTEQPAPTPEPAPEPEVADPEPPREPVVEPAPPPKEPPPRKPAPKEHAPKPPPLPGQPPPPPDQPPPPPPPPLMGINLEGTATAPPGSGIAVPAGGQRDGERYGEAHGQGPRGRGPKAPTGDGDGAAPPGDPTVPVSGVTSLPRLLNGRDMIYPDKLRALGVEGSVVVEVVVGSDGAVRSVRLIKRLHPQLDAVALRRARLLRYDPARVGGRAVAVRIPHTFHFVLQ